LSRSRLFPVPVVSATKILAGFVEDTSEIVHDVPEPSVTWPPEFASAGAIGKQAVKPAVLSDDEQVPAVTIMSTGEVVFPFMISLSVGAASEGPGAMRTPTISRLHT